MKVGKLSADASFSLSRPDPQVLFKIFQRTRLHPNILCKRAKLHLNIFSRGDLGCFKG